MSGVESAYLKEAVGSILSKGLSAVAMAEPQDPVEYLSLFMLHQIQKQELSKQQAQAARVLEQQREEWAVTRARRENEASEIIQRQWKAHLHLLEDARMADEELKNVFADIEEGELGGGEGEGGVGEEEDEYQQGGAGGAGEETGEPVEVERNSAFNAFKRARLFVRALDKKVLGAMKLTTPLDNFSAMVVLKCVLYLQGAKPKQITKPSQIRLRWKPYHVMQFLHGYDPCSTTSEAGLPRKRNINRVRRLLTLVSEDQVRGVSVALHAIFSWLHSVVGFRYARDALVKSRREQGTPIEGLAGDLDEEDEDPEDLPAGERDTDEEEVREQELESQRQAEAEAAAAAAEAQDEEDMEN